MTLNDLLNGLEILKMRGESSFEITDITYHSSKVKSGSLFVAIKGLKADGHDFISEAIARGAKAIILEDPRRVIPNEITMIVVPNSRKALAQLSTRFYEYPSQALKLIGVTGTNGKTTTTFLIESLLKEAGFNPGVIGTISYRLGGNETVATHTTPESLDLQKILFLMKAGGATHAVMEVSSHALDQERVWGCSFTGAVFTNLTPEHLDYHQDMDSYFKCKEKLFKVYLKEDGFAIINWDDSWGKIISQDLSLNCLRYGIKERGDIWAEDVTFNLEGLKGKIFTPLGILNLESQLIGEINLYNLLAAVGVGVALGVPLNHIEIGVAQVKGIPGRLEKIHNEYGFTILVDYAHTSDALKRVLVTLRGLTKGRIITIFGCGGDRDRSKRPRMGEISGQYSDLTIITSDNPRSEDPLEIIAEIERGIKGLKIPSWTEGCQKGYLVIPDRREAIAEGIRHAKRGDLVLIAGKGHETYQIVKDRKIHFDDREEAQNALRVLSECGR